MRGLSVAEIAGNQSEARPPSWLVRIVVEKPLDDRSHPREPPLLAPNPEHLHAQDAADMLALAAPAHLERLLGNPVSTHTVTVDRALHAESMPGHPPV